VKFKNELERRTFEIAQRVCGKVALIEHNRVLRIETAISPEVASFIGPPKKEIDVITAGFDQCPDVKVLISCKEYRESKAEPADVQEWAAVVRTMNQYSTATKYLGLIISPSGFTSGCEPWATSYNLGVIPPLKGRPLKFETNTCDQMFERVLTAFGKRLHFSHANLFDAPQFYEFVYHLTEAFEGRDNTARDYGERYRLLGKGWLSSFQELIRTFKDQAIEDIEITSVGVYLSFSGGLTFRMIGNQVQFGVHDGKIDGSRVDIICHKNFSGESCSMDFVKNLVIGQRVISAGDWGTRFEFGLSDDLMLAIEPGRIQIYRTRNPVDENLL
jgi:hypothetical protein